MQGTVPGGRRRGRPKKFWHDSIKEWTELPLAKTLRLAEDKDGWRKIIKTSVVPLQPVKKLETSKQAIKKKMLNVKRKTESVTPSVVSVSISGQDGIVTLGKAHTLSAPSLSSPPKVAIQTVPMFVGLNIDRSRPRRVECRPLPFSAPLSFRQ